MEQLYDQYTSEDHQVWKVLFERQIANLQNKACGEYLDSLEQLAPALNNMHVPDFRELNAVLGAANGWSIAVVPGLIPVHEFYDLLCQRKFPSSTWLRKMSQLDYLEEPDMFHDIFGHVPILMHPEFAAFTQQLGEVGKAHANNELVALQMQRLYWYTIEFGLIKGIDGTEIYGAGILSSFGEAKHIYKPETSVLPFNLEEVIERPFINTEIQTTYYAIDSFDQLFDALNIYQRKL